MCAACIEYAKDLLTTKEFQSALREMTIDDQAHAEAVARIMRDYAMKPDEMKRKLKALAEGRD